jgi:DNA-directed RNA polymerase specialized sigma24 family protein
MHFNAKPLSFAVRDRPQEKENMVDGAAKSGGEWSLSQSSLEKFLSCLDPDPERAGEKYEAIRLQLIKFFDWRSAPFPEERADETITRVIRKIDEGENFRDVSTYCYGVARMVYLESRKRLENRRVALDDAPQIAAPAPPSEEEDEREQCLAHCLRELPLESRRIILKYYEDDRRRKINNRVELAASLGIPLNALRSRAQRIRDKLEQCVLACLKKRAHKK